MKSILYCLFTIISIQIYSQESTASQSLNLLSSDNSSENMSIEIHKNIIKDIFSTSLQKGESYQMLDYLCNEIGHRLSGSPQAAQAVEWTKKTMEEYGFDTVFLQPVMVPHWIRGDKEQAKIISSQTGEEIKVNVLALGNSVGTGKKGITSQIIEVKSVDQLEKIGSKIKGKIVFFNGEFDQSHLTTFTGYGEAVMQRVYGPSDAAKYGAVGVVVRTVGTAYDDYPQTGTLVYKEDAPQIPAIAISTNDADVLSEMLAKEAGLKFYFQTNCEMLPDVLSYNVVGEIRGSKNPDEYIVVGGHLDSWDVGDGAHDDGAGCMQSIEVLRLFKELNIKPNRTIRAVMFMNEENGLRGGKEYARLAKENDEKHIAALESDSGGFSPKGFTFFGSDKQKSSYLQLKEYFEPYHIFSFDGEGGGADIDPLQELGTACIGLYPDSQRYFDYHHAGTDTFDKVNRRELELGAASMAALIYLIDQNGL